jgi:hypothetical protein
MKKILLCLFILLSLSQARASDTLTVRQVYSFCVGDTFDYSEVTNNYDYNLFTTSFARVVISQVYISPGQDSFIYNNNWVITNLDSIAVYQIDTGYYHMTTQVSFFDTSSFWGRNSNRIGFPNADGGTYSNVTDSLGLTISGYSMASTINSGYYTDTYEKRLIYFSDGHRSFGTPYYDQYAYLHLGILNQDIVNSIHLYPNPTTDQIHLSISEVNGPDYQLFLTDILGQEVYTSPVTQSESTFDISNLSQGIYTWRLMENNSIVKAGKIVKE